MLPSTYQNTADLANHPFPQPPVCVWKQEALDLDGTERAQRRYCTLFPVNSHPAVKLPPHHHCCLT